MASRNAAVILLLLALGCANAAVVILDCARTNSNEVTVNAITTQAVVKCPAGCKAPGGYLYGTNTYTSDSRICRAAIHAGKITNSGGQFTLYYAKGLASYTGNTKNGITSLKYGAWTSSFKFAGPALPPTIDCKKTNAARDVVGVGDVPYSRSKLNVTCPAGCLSAGSSIYGAGAYTSDSPICLAAIHAGVIKSTGGTFTIYDFPGQASYRGFSANGIVSKSYGSWGHSYRMRPVTTLACGSTNTANLLVNTTLPTAFATCPPNCYDAGGDAYGYLNYRSNSRVCLAAQHAGVITGNGGMVIVRYVKGLSSYTGKLANFITTKSAGGSPHAFKFL
ncbi:hypothetical protein D9Q98_007634 [Chlorella vulgaris]|uniref:LCCL domain-containing protein n=1 Tax=Chlorella vulgaris TaxID=3077 RepID=A0A9D4YVQ0_CHLVU|nr:hypothetical protein D9Q98_007634 [Chlorella vulgaris]